MLFDVRYISIHAPREGRDVGQGGIPSLSPYFNPRAPRGARPNRVFNPCNSSNISIHAPREGRDVIIAFYFGTQSQFQSTRPARGATLFVSVQMWYPLFQSTRPARGATHRKVACGALYGISIHAPREGRDENTRKCVRSQKPFQSTRPARGATAKVNKFLRTFLQKRHGFQIFLRKTLPFKAFCRLQIGKNFSICGANRCGNFCELVLRTIRSSVPRADTSACSRSVRFYSRTSCPSSKIEGCPFLGQ